MHIDEGYLEEDPENQLELAGLLLSVLTVGDSLRQIHAVSFSKACLTELFFVKSW